MSKASQVRVVHVCECGHDRFVEWMVVKVDGKTVAHETTLRCENCRRTLKVNR